MKMTLNRRFELSTMFLMVAIIAAVINLSDACPCSSGFHKVIFPNRTRNFCRPCSRCPPGYGLSVPCDTEISGDANIECVPCTPGTNYSSGFDLKSCQPCRNLSCYPNEKFDGKCTPEEDTTECKGTCVKGYFWTNNSTNPCQPCFFCGNGRNVKRVGKCVKDGMPPKKQCTPQFKTGTKLTGQTLSNNQTKLPNRTLVKNLKKLIEVKDTLLANVSKEKNQSQSMNDGQLTKRIPEKDKDEVQSSTGKAKLIIALTVFSVVVVILVTIVLVQCLRESESCQQPNRCFLGLHGEADDVESIDTELESSNNEVNRRSRKTSSDNGDPLEMNPLTSNQVNDSSNNFAEAMPSLSTPEGTPSSQPKILLNNGEASVHNVESQSVVLGSTNENEEGPSSTGITYNGHILSNGQSTSRKANLRIGNLNGGIYGDLCKKLNISILRKDWKTLAGLMGYTNEELKTFELQKDPADALLLSWGTKFKNDVNRLIQMLKTMERDDLVELLEAAE